MDILQIDIKPGHLWSAGIIWPIVCTGVVVARFRTRQIHSKLGWDDWLAVPALLCVCGLSAAVIYGVATKALGYPDTDGWDGNYVDYQSRSFTVKRQIYWSAMVVQAPALAFIKLSCLTFYRRVFKTGINRVPEAILWALIAIMLIWGISFTVASLFFCGTLNHLEWMWGRAGDYLKCTTDTYMLQQAFAISDVVTDALIVVFPLPYIWKLQMSLGRKIALIFIFMMGSATIAMSAVRLECLLQSVDATKALVSGTQATDPGVILTTITYFMFLEAGFGLCAICLPALSGSLKLPGVQTFFRNISSVFSVRSGASSTSSNHHGSHYKSRRSGEKSSTSSERPHMEKNRVYTERNFSVTSERV